MSEITNGHKGIELAKAEKWDDAISHLTKAIAVRPSPAWLLARAQAYQAKGDVERALVDCEHALVEAAQRQSNRDEHMREAQYRRGVLAFKQGRLADADACCTWAMRLALGFPARERPDPVAARAGPDGVYTATLQDAQRDNEAALLVDKAQGGGGGGDLAMASKKKEWVRPYSFRVVVLGAMEKLPVDAPGRRLTVTREPKPPKLVKGEYNPEGQASTSAAANSSNAAATTAVPSPAAAAPPKEQKLRVDFFQNKEVITLSIFIKGAEKDRLAVEHVGSDVVVVRNLPRESNPTLTLRLSHPVVPAETKHKVFGTKVELTLRSGAPGQKWQAWGSEVTGEDAAALAGSAAAGTPASTPVPATTATTTNTATTTASAAADKPPAYPTSAKGGPKNWEQVGDDEDAEAKDQDVDAFFKNLYKNAPPEAQRAMMKSYIESNGTALSTDWNNVKDGKVATQPPAGAEAKKW